MSLLAVVGCASDKYVPPIGPFGQTAVSSFAPAPVAATPMAPSTPLALTPVRAVPHAMRSPAPVSHSLSTAAPLTASPDLKVMTFNLRVATAFDGLNTWEFRKGQVVERIREANPDLLGTQEGLRGMEEYLQKQLSDYTFLGVGRNDGKTGGEYCGVFYKTDKFEKLDSGHFWLSTNPEKPGSKGWGAWFPRMVTWVKLRPVHARDGSHDFVWFNTHFDAFASKARTESARLLLSRMPAITGGLQSIVTGDFNAGQGSEPYRMLCSTLAGYGPVLVDAFRAANPKQTREEGTRHDFNGHKDGDRIDWILASPTFQAVSVTIDRARGLLGYPSDHFPVVATFRPTPSNLNLPVARIE
jgi:endonuclease/exonuclease/phosphatase family metal-dependent hydrolase